MLLNESTRHCVNSFVAATRRTFCFETLLARRELWFVYNVSNRDTLVYNGCGLSENFVEEIIGIVHIVGNGRTDILLRLNVTAFKSHFYVFESY